MEKAVSRCINEMQKDLNDQRAKNAAINRQLKKTQDAADEMVHKLQEDYTEAIAVLAIVLSKYCPDGYAVIDPEELRRIMLRIGEGEELVDVGENIGGGYILRGEVCGK